MSTTRQFGLSIRSTYFWVAVVLSFLVFALRDIVTLTVEQLSVDKLTAAYSMQLCTMYIIFIYVMSKHCELCVWWFCTWFI